MWGKKIVRYFGMSNHRSNEELLPPTGRHDHDETDEA